jgi:hypothetical protein
MPAGAGTRIQWNYRFRSKPSPRSVFLRRFVARDFKAFMEAGMQEIRSTAEGGLPSVDPDREALDAPAT